MYIINFIRGFCMALADSVPGVSGGSIAFILGFYDKFINSLNNIVSGTKESRKEGIKFLFKIGIGWVSGMILSLLLLASIFEKEIYNISSLFIGFIVSSIPIIIKEEKDFIIGKYRNIIFAVMGVAVATLLTFFNPAKNSGINIESFSLTFGFSAYIFAAGMIAISAMVLPGISGSTILLILGLYTGIISSVKEVITLNFEYLPIVIIFTLGVITGIALTVRVIRNLLKYYKSQTIYAILGLMIGSIYSIILGPTSLKIPQMPMTMESFNIIFFVIGIILMMFLQFLKGFLKKN